MQWLQEYRSFNCYRFRGQGRTRLFAEYSFNEPKTLLSNVTCRVTSAHVTAFGLVASFGQLSDWLTKSRKIFGCFHDIDRKCASFLECCFSIMNLLVFRSNRPTANLWKYHILRGWMKFTISLLQGTLRLNFGKKLEILSEASSTFT